MDWPGWLQSLDNNLSALSIIYRYIELSSRWIKMSHSVCLSQSYHICIKGFFFLQILTTWHQGFYFIMQRECAMNSVCFHYNQSRLLLQTTNLQVESTWVKFCKDCSGGVGIHRDLGVVQAYTSSFLHDPSHLYSVQHEWQVSWDRTKRVGLETRFRNANSC